MGEILISGLSKNFKDNNEDVNPDEIYSLFNHTHPGVVERILAIKKTLYKRY